MPTVECKAVEEVKIEFDKDTYVALDGELFYTKRVHLKLRPGLMQFIGKVEEFEEWEKELIYMLGV